MGASTANINQLVILTVSGHQADELAQQLVKNQFYFTKIDSQGGGFQEPTLCLLIGLNSSRLNSLLSLVNRCCKPYRQYIPAQISIPPNYSPLPMIEAQMGGALVYVINIEQFEQI